MTPTSKRLLKCSVLNEIRGSITRRPCKLDHIAQVASQHRAIFTLHVHLLSRLILSPECFKMLLTLLAGTLIIGYVGYCYLKHKKVLSGLPHLYAGSPSDLLKGDPIRLADRADAIAREMGSRIFSVNILNYYIVIILDQDLLKKIFVEKGKFTSGRHVFPSFASSSLYNGAFIQNDGPHLMHLRKTTISGMRELGYGGRQMEKVVIDQTKYCCTILGRIAEEGTPVDLFPLLMMITTNVIHKLSYNFTFEYDDPTLKRLQQAQMTFQDFGLLPNIQKLLPAWMTKMPFVESKDFTSFRTAMKTMMDYARERIDERVKNGENSRADLLDIFLQSEDTEGKPFTREELTRFISELLTGGSATTVFVLSWALKALAHDPGLQERLHEDVKDVPLDTLSWEDLPGGGRGLQFVHAFVHEAIRFGNIAPMLIPHRVTGDFTMQHDGQVWSFPKDTLLLANATSIHRDPAIWRDPLNFNPAANFLSPETGEFLANENLVAFGMGPRICLGERLAKSELLIVVVSLVQQFKFERQQDDHWSMEEAEGNLTRRPANYRVIVKKR